MISVLKDAAGALRAAQGALANRRDDLAREAKGAANAEAEVAKAEAVAQASRAKADADDADKSLDAAARDEARLAAKKTKHAAAKAKHAAAEREVAQADAQVTGAQRDLKAAELTERRAERMVKLRDLGEKMQAAANALVAQGLQAHAHLQDDANDCRALGELGQHAVPTDALPLASGIGSNLVASKAPLEWMGGATKVRWIPGPLTNNLQSPENSALGFVQGLVVLAAATTRPPKDEPAVRAEVESWTNCSHYGEILREREEQRQRELAERSPHLHPVVNAPARQSVVHLGGDRPATDVRRIGSR